MHRKTLAAVAGGLIFAVGLVTVQAAQAAPPAGQCSGKVLRTADADDAPGGTPEHQSDASVGLTPNGDGSATFTITIHVAEDDKGSCSKLNYGVTLYNANLFPIDDATSPTIGSGSANGNGTTAVTLAPITVAAGDLVDRGAGVGKCVQWVSTVTNAKGDVLDRAPDSAGGANETCADLGPGVRYR